MHALILTSGGLIPARVISAWLATGNSVAAIWVGTKSLRRLDRNQGLRVIAPAWSILGLARRYNLPIRAIPLLRDWGDAEAEIAKLGTDVLITAATDNIVPDDVLRLFPCRAVNFHGSLLPHYRGPNPTAGMILDGVAEIYGGMTMHCLSTAIDMGDIIGARRVPYDENRGFLYWQVCLARAAESLARHELIKYLRGGLPPVPQTDSGNYRKMGLAELTLSSTDNMERIKWLCDIFGSVGWLSYRSRLDKRNFVSHFISELKTRAAEAERIDHFTIAFDVADGRVKLARFGNWARLVRALRYWQAIVRTWWTSDDP